MLAPELLSSFGPSSVIRLDFRVEVYAGNNQVDKSWSALQNQKVNFGRSVLLTMHHPRHCSLLQYIINIVQFVKCIHAYLSPPQICTELYANYGDSSVKPTPSPPLEN